jgi:hypothetical protein
MEHKQKGYKIGETQEEGHHLWSIYLIMISGMRRNPQWSTSKKGYQGGETKPLEYLSDYDLGDEEEEPPMEHKQRRVPKRRPTRGRSPPKPMMRRGPQGRAQP